MPALPQIARLIFSKIILIACSWTGSIHSSNTHSDLASSKHSINLQATYARCLKHPYFGSRSSNSLFIESITLTPLEKGSLPQSTPTPFEITPYISPHQHGGRC